MKTMEKDQKAEEFSVIYQELENGDKEKVALTAQKLLSAQKSIRGENGLHAENGNIHKRNI